MAATGFSAAASTFAATLGAAKGAVLAAGAGDAFAGALAAGAGAFSGAGFTGALPAAALGAAALAGIAAAGALTAAVFTVLAVDFAVTGFLLFEVEAGAARDDFEGVGEVLAEAAEGLAAGDLVEVLVGAVLAGAVLAGAVLAVTVLAGATLTAAGFEVADLAGADLADAALLAGAFFVWLAGLADALVEDALPALVLGAADFVAFACAEVFAAGRLAFAASLPLALVFDSAWALPA